MGLETLKPHFGDDLDVEGDSEVPKHQNVRRVGLPRKNKKTVILVPCSWILVLGRCLVVGFLDP